MAGDGGFGPFGRYWQMLKELNIAAEREQMPLLLGRDASVMVNGGGFLHRECGVPESTLPKEFMRDGWMSPRDSFSMDFLGIGTSPSNPKVLEITTHISHHHWIRLRLNTHKSKRKAVKRMGQ